MKYLGKPSYVHSVASLTEAFQRMLDISVTLGDSLIDDLASDMGSAIVAANSSISFISGSSETQERRDWAVVFAQAIVFTQADDAKEKAQDMGFDPLKEKQLFDWLIEDYHEWPFLKDPVPNWNKRLRSLRSEQDPNKEVLRLHEANQ